MTDLELRTGENDLLALDNLFFDFLADDMNIFDGHEFSSDGKALDYYPSDNAASFSIGEIENFLLNDDFEPLDAQNTDAFLSDLLVDSPPTLDAGSDSSLSPPSPVQSNNSKDLSPSISDEKDHHLHPSEDKIRVHSDDAIDENDPNAKKRKRQLRNRDAAVRSRERKKMYVRDLEMKSRYYEAECRRLEWMLQCVRAENQALQFALHTNHQAFGTSAKQESAVLLLESLLLGSLLWLMGIIGLFMLPRQLLAILGAALVGNAEEKYQTSQAPRKIGNDVFGMPILQFFMKSKRWRGSRTRMKMLPTRSCKCLISSIAHPTMNMSKVYILGVE